MDTNVRDIPLDANHAIVWKNDALYLLDQRLLPSQGIFIQLDTAVDTANAIRDMVVRGAPAIGVTAAYGMVLAARSAFRKDRNNWRQLMQKEVSILEKSRPTAVNLFWAIKEMQALISALPENDDPYLLLLDKARQIHEDDIACNKSIGRLGAECLTGRNQVITHCNAGALATGGYGTALGVIRSAVAEGKIDKVYADETRPWMQGARLTAWELIQDNIDTTLLTDSAAALLMKQGMIDWIIVGADRIAANGDVANKIGTYSLAIAAKYHGVKVMVAAPKSTIDMACNTGEDIPLEYRNPSEVLSFGGEPIAGDGVEAWNPVFDVTPAALIDVIVTESKAIVAPNADKLSQLFVD